MRTRMLEAAEELLNASPDRDIATRAVCEAVGVGAPVLYRLFGDKNGLLSALRGQVAVEPVVHERAAEPSEDPVTDLRNGWDTHVEFAKSHPAVYRLMFSPSFATVPSAAQEAMRLLRQVLDRCAAAGRLRVESGTAAQMIMSANIGVALNLVTQPENYPDPDLSPRVRDAVHAAVLVPDRTTEPAGGDGSPVVAALQLAAILRDRETGLGEPETALLLHWLDTLAGAKA
jgi:AcrR family transcriptional regulator